MREGGGQRRGVVAAEGLLDEDDLVGREVPDGDPATPVRDALDLEAWVRVAEVAQAPSRAQKSTLACSLC